MPPFFPFFSSPKIGWVAKTRGLGIFFFFARPPPQMKYFGRRGGGVIQPKKNKSKIWAPTQGFSGPGPLFKFLGGNKRKIKWVFFLENIFSLGKKILSGQISAQKPATQKFFLLSDEKKGVLFA